MKTLTRRSLQPRRLRRVRKPLSTMVVASLIACAIGATTAEAQLNTQHIKGTVGLKSGSQPPPHRYVIAPLLYTYNTDTVKDRDGDRLPLDADLTMWAYGAGLVLVTNKKVLGGYYGFQCCSPA